MKCEKHGCEMAYTTDKVCPICEASKHQPPQSSGRNEVLSVSESEEYASVNQLNVYARMFAMPEEMAVKYLTGWRDAQRAQGRREAAEAYCAQCDIRDPTTCDHPPICWKRATILGTASKG